MDINQIINRLKKHPIVVSLLLIVGAIGGAASLFSSIEDIGQLAAKYLTKDPSPQIGRMRNPLSDEEASNKGFTISYAQEDDHKYALILSITATFKDKKFNRAPYLNSVSKLDVFSPPSSSVPFHVQRIYTESSENSKGLQWWAFIVFESKPTASQKLSFSLGPNRWDVPFGSHAWKPFPYEYGATKNQWHSTQGELHLALEDPSWPLVRSARLLESNDDNVSLLEVVIENRSGEPIPIETLVVSASHPKDSSVSCMEPDQQQSLSLDWGVIASDATGNGAWTNLGETTVRVPVRYNGRGVCSPFSFWAAVPVMTDIDPGKVGRVILRVAEMPTPNEPSRSSLSLGEFGVPMPTVHQAPRSLLHWKRLQIGVNPSEKAKYVFPKVVAVERAIDNSMLLKE